MPALLELPTRKISRDQFTRGLRQGYWFCEREERLVELSDETDTDTPARCPQCGHATAVWHPPSLKHEIQTSPSLSPFGWPRIGRYRDWLLSLR